MQTIVLNSDYMYLGSITVQKAIKLILRQRVEVMKESDVVIRSTFKTIVVPLVVKLIDYVSKRYGSKITFSKPKVFYRDDYICQYCNGYTENPTCDHILPESRGGKSTFENCVCSCERCNQKKDNRTPEEANMKLLRKPYHPIVFDFLKKRMNRLNIQEQLHNYGIL